MDSLPKELVHIILEYDGRIKYRQGEYINIIHPADQRYTNLVQIIEKKQRIIKNTNANNTSDEFYFEFEFEKEKEMGLCFASGGFSACRYTERHKIEICYFNFKNNNVEQHRIYI